MQKNKYKELLVALLTIGEVSKFTKKESRERNRNGMNMFKSQVIPGVAGKWFHRKFLNF